MFVKVYYADSTGCTLLGDQQETKENSCLTPIQDYSVLREKYLLFTLALYYSTRKISFLQPVRPTEKS